MIKPHVGRQWSLPHLWPFFRFSPKTVCCGHTLKGYVPFILKSLKAICHKAGRKAYTLGEMFYSYLILTLQQTDLPSSASLTASESKTEVSMLNVVVLSSPCIVKPQLCSFKSVNTLQKKFAKMSFSNNLRKNITPCTDI